MKIVGNVLIWAVVLGGLVWIARPPAPSVNNAPAAVSGTGTLEAQEASFSFGGVSMAAGVVRHGFAVRNTGSAPVKITKAYTSCMCTTATFLLGDDRLGPFGMPGHGFVPPVNRTISPGEEFTVEAAFDPAAHGPAGVGRIARTITLETDAGRPVTLGFDATVTP